jgi:hypothetical protein
MTAPTKITPTELIATREILISEIKTSWNLIINNNVFPKEMMPLYNLEAVYTQIIKDEIDLIDTKIKLQAINFGIKDLSLIPKDSAFYTIFLLQQIKERAIKLAMIPTKKEDTEKVAFSRKFINDEITKLNTEITTLEEKLVAFNAGEINNAA